MTKNTYLQTDIGSDIDDAWAVAMLLKSPELNLKMVLTDTGNTIYRAALVCKMLESAGREDVIVGAGDVLWPEPPDMRTQVPWVSDYDVLKKPNFTRDGIDRFIEMIKAEPEPVNLIAIGPVTNLAEALRRAPEIAEKIDFSGMFGSVYKGYDGGPEISREYNVYQDTPASQVVFSANWHSAVITPLDTCGQIRLDAAHMATLRGNLDPIMKDVMELYDIWMDNYKIIPHLKESSVLYDTIAVFMTYSREYMRYERLNIKVDDQGYTRIDNAGKSFDVAVEWTDMPGYCDFLTECLQRPIVPAK